MISVQWSHLIDRWVGPPLCFLSTWVLRALALSSRLSPGREPKRVLFIELSEMGSAILADPAMRWIRDQGTELHFAIFERNCPSVALTNTVPPENVFTIRNSGLVALAIDSVRFLLWTRSRGIDTVVDLEMFSRYSALLTGFSGAARRVGLYEFHRGGIFRGEMLTHRVAYNPHIHTAKMFMALAQAAMAPPGEVPFTKKHISERDIRVSRVTVSADARWQMLQRVRKAAPGFDPGAHRLVLINPNSSRLLPQRRWFAGNFVNLIGMMLGSASDVFVLITGDESEVSEAEALACSVADARCVSFAGQTRIPELPALYELCELMVTNDSGPSHFAAVTRMPTYVLFGPETPKLYSSLGPTTSITAGLACSPCVSATNRKTTVCQDPVCMKAILPEHVFTVLKPRLMAPRSFSESLQL